MIVLDTSALIFWTMDSPRLSNRAAHVIAQADLIVISSISIWEIGIKSKRERLTLPMPLADFVERLKAVERVRIDPVDEGTWMRNIELDWDHKDPADRTIVALASMQGCELVTSDARIRSYYADSVW